MHLTAHYLHFTSFTSSFLPDALQSPPYGNSCYQTLIFKTKISPPSVSSCFSIIVKGISRPREFTKDPPSNFKVDYIVFVLKDRMKCWHFVVFSLQGLDSVSSSGQLRPLNAEISAPRIDSYRFSMANLEDSQDVDLDAILGELCALETQCEREIGHARDSKRISGNESVHVVDLVIQD